MLDLAAAQAGLQLLFGSADAWLVVIPGILVGLIGGALPGVSGSMTLALVLPLTLYMDFLTALLFLTSIFTGAAFGGAIPAILVNLPGETAAASSAFDGFPMARRGEHNEALGLGLAAATLGEMLSYLFLMLVLNHLAWAVLKLGPLEMLLVAIWGLTMIASLRGEIFSRGLFAAGFGLILGTVGIGPTGLPRDLLGIEWLIDGIPEVPAMIGLLAIGELFNLSRSRYIVERSELRSISFRRIIAGFAMVTRYPVVLLRGSLIGIVIGLIPGIGASVATLVSYADAKRSAKDKDTFGQGNPKGLVASEAANSSSEGGSMAILLALGIPGGAGTAVMLAAFAMHNITGGPRFIHDNKDIVYAIIFSNFFQSLILILVGILFIRVVILVILVPVRMLVPAILVLSVCGTYALTGNMSGPITLFVFSVLGWLFHRHGFTPAAAVVGLLLGSSVEGELVRTWQISGGAIEYAFERPIALTVFVLLVVSLGWRPLAALARHWRGRAAARV